VELEDGVTGIVGACGSEVADGCDLLGFAEQVEAEEEGIDADVEQGAAAQAEVKEASVGIEGGKKAEVGADIAEVADLAIADQLGDLFCQGQETGPHGLHKEGAVGACGIYHFAHLTGGESHGLFAEDGLAMAQAKNGVFGVIAMGRSDVDCVDGRVGGQRFITIVDADGILGAAVVCVCKRQGARNIAGGDGAEAGAFNKGQGDCEFVGDLSGPDDTPCKLLHGVKIRVYLRKKKDGQV